MTKEQLDLLLVLINAKISFWLEGYPKQMAAQQINDAVSALYASIETHTELEDLPDAELFGQTEGVAK